MTEINKRQAQKLLDLDQQLEQELRAFSDNVGALTEAPERKQYDRFCGHLNYIQELLNDADQLLREVPLDRNDPSFFSLLKAKGSIQQHAVTYARLRGSFFSKYRVEEERDQDLERVLEPEEVHPEIEELLSEEPEDLSEEEQFQLEQDANAEAAMLAAEEEAEAAKAKKAKHKKEQRRIEEVQRRQRQEALALEDAERLKQAQAEHQHQIDEQEALLRAQQEEQRFTERETLHQEAQQVETVQIPSSDRMIQEPAVQLSDVPEQVQHQRHQEPAPAFTTPQDTVIDTPQVAHTEPVSLQPLPFEESIQPVSNAHPFEQHDEIQRDRWEEATRMGIRYDPRKELSEAELYAERARQEEDSRLAEQAAEGRRAHDAEVQERYRQRQEAAEQHVRLEKGHVDFSHDLYGDKADHPQERELPTADVPPVADGKSTSSVEPQRFKQETPVSGQDTQPARPQTNERVDFKAEPGLPTQEPVVVQKQQDDTPLSRQEEEQRIPPVFSDKADVMPEPAAFHQQPDNRQEVHSHVSTPESPAPDRRDPFHAVPEPKDVHQEPFKTVVPPLSPKDEEVPSRVSANRHDDEQRPSARTESSSPHTPYHEASTGSQQSDASVPEPGSSPERPASLHTHDPYTDAVRTQDHRKTPLQDGKDPIRPTVVPPLSQSEEKASAVGENRQQTQSSRHSSDVQHTEMKPQSSGEKPQSSGETIRPKEEPVSKPSDTRPAPREVHRYRLDRQTQGDIHHFKAQPGTFSSPRSAEPTSSGTKTSPIYRSTPFGVREDQRMDPAFQPSRNNEQIYSKIKRSMERSGEDKPVTISSTYLSSMAWNVHMARIEYQGKKDTAEAVPLAQAYQRQRQALESLKSDVRSGRVLVEQPKTTETISKPQKPDAPKSPFPTQYHSTPFGVTGTNIGPDGQVTGSFRIHNKEVRKQFNYTAESPLIVSPKYEAAMQERLQKATTSLDTALKLKTKVPPKISSSMHDEVRLSQDAYAAFQQAKQAGVVVVSDKSDLHKPDFQRWQQRKQANIFGTTVHHKAFDPTAPKKAEVEEHGASILTKKSKLRNEHFYSYYVRRIGQKTTAYSYQASQILSRNLYMILQSGEDNAVRTFESGRYYAVTAAQVASAVAHLHVVAPARFQRKASTQELHRFAKYLGKDNHTLSREIISKKQLARKGKQTIRSLKAQNNALLEKINGINHRGAVLSAEDTHMLKRLGIQQRKVSEKLSAAQRAHFSLNRDLRREVAYFKLRKQNADEARILKELKQKNGMFVTRSKLQRDIKETQTLAQKKLVQKYGKEITAFSDKSVKQEIKMLTKQGKALKSQIKALQAKGASLTQAQRASLKQLMDKHQALSKRLRSLIGLDKDRAIINAELQFKHGLLMRMNQNANAFYSAMFAFKRFALRPLREGAEAGTQGFAAGVSVMTNRHVHLMLKKTFKAAIRYAPSTVAFLATGDMHTARAAATYAERAAKMVTTRTKLAVKRTTKKATKLAVQETKKAVSKIAPQPLKKGAHYISSTLRKRFNVLSNLKTKVSRKFWASGVGRALSTVREFGGNAMKFAKAAAKLVKSVVVKLVAGFVLLFLICGMIASLGGAPAGGAAGGIILSPYEGAEGKIDLSPYVDILNECQAEYDEKIENNRVAYLEQYDKVTIVPAIPDNNSREILSMMAVRCSQDLELSNAMVECYLKSIFEDSHFFTTEESDFYSCSGCKTKKVSSGHKADCPDPCYSLHLVDEKYCPGTHQDLTMNLHVLFFDEIFTADSMGNEGQTAVAGQEIGTFKITHYCACSECCGKAPSDPAYGITATGTKATEGRTIAVDPNVIPLGTHVVIDGVEYVAEDVGGAIDGNRIDIFVGSHQEALNKGVKNLPVYYASYEGESVVETGEWDGWTEDNVFWCKTIYGMDWKELYTGIPNVTDVVGNETNLDGVTFIDGDRAGNDAIVNTAMAQLGQVGGQPFWSWYGFDSRVEWCATFVSWCADQNGVLGTSIPKFASCRYQGVPWFQEQGQWASADDIVPVAGDIIFFDWEGDGVPNHVGIVIGTDGDKVYTVEGNSGDVVKTKSYNLKSNLIFGYGLPNY